MRIRGRRGRLVATALGTMIATVAAGGWAAGGPTSAADAPAGAEAQRLRPAAVHTVTLLTGDKVTVATGPDGKPTAQIVRGPGRARMPYATRAYGSHLFVTPAD